MARNILIFLATFAVGALIAFTTRAVRYKPEQAPSEHATHLRSPMVSNPLTAAGAAGTTAAKPEAPTSVTVNTVCAICGMKVDPNVPTLEYQGNAIGFGCRMCPPKFKAEPDKYGPLYLRNEVAKR